MFTPLLTSILLIALGLWLTTCIFIVRQQTVRVIETFGKFSRTAQAGLGFKLPWPIQVARGDFSLQILEISEDVNVKSSDNAFVSVPIRVQYKVNDAQADRAFYLLSEPEEQIRSYVVNQVRSTASSLTFENLFRSRDDFEKAVQETLTDRMSDFGYIIENVLVDDPQPSADLRQAFDRVIAAQRLKEAAENEGEAKRILSVAEANAEGEALEIKANAYARFRNIVADGNAEALDKFCATTGLKSQDGLDFFISINEMEAVRDAASNGGRVVFVAGSAQKNPDSALTGLVAQVGAEAAESAPASGEEDPAPASQPSAQAASQTG